MLSLNDPRRIVFSGQDLRLGKETKTPPFRWEEKKAQIKSQSRRVLEYLLMLSKDIRIFKAISCQNKDNYLSLQLQKL